MKHCGCRRRTGKGRRAELPGVNAPIEILQIVARCSVRWFRSGPCTRISETVQLLELLLEDREKRPWLRRRLILEQLADIGFGWHRQTNLS